MPVVTKEKSVVIKKKPPKFEIDKKVEVIEKDFEHAKKKPAVDPGYVEQKGYDEGGFDKGFDRGFDRGYDEGASRIRQ